MFKLLYSSFYEKKIGDKITFTFDDNSTAVFKYTKRFKPTKYYPKYKQMITRYIKDGRYQTQYLDTNTAYLKLNIFNLLEVDIDSITSFFKTLNDSLYKNVIIDVRNNGGGSGAVLNYIYSLIADKPFVNTIKSKVNSNKEYKFFKNVDNYSEDDVLFPGYTVEKSDGFYTPDSVAKHTNPHDSINFSGKVFVLTNDRSVSSSAILARLVHKYKRGKIVGRETGSSYYQMNAVKFAYVRMKHTNSYMRMPLIKCIFQEEVVPGIPWGRGVIPDYPIEMEYANYRDYEDYDLDYTLKVIEREKIKDKEQKRVLAIERIENTRRNNLIGAGVMVFLSVLGIGYYIKNRKNTHEF